MIVKAEDHLSHYGTPRHSGRYPWGSGGAETTRNRHFLDSVEKMKNDGLSETEIARGLGITTTQLRAQRTIALNQQKQEKINMAQRLKDKGLSNVKIGERMGINESSVRALLAPGVKDKTDILQSTADMLKRQVEEKGYIDVGVHVEKALPIGNNPAARIGISKDKFNTAIAMLQEQGYKLHYFKVPQLNAPGQFTTTKVLSKIDAPFPKLNQIKSITDFSTDHGHTYLGIKAPLSISSRRIAVKYAEDGGDKADGIIYVRPGVKDISIGKNNYAQVRIQVDGTHYMKGMAVYKDDLPEGTDLVFNTSKSSTGRKKDAFKAIKDDPDNPFGATVRQIIEVGKDGKERVTSAMNIVNEEGDWDKWSRNLSSQFLSKQSPALAKKQLDVTFENRKKEFDRISELTNPTVRKKLLNTFADETDSAAVHLQAAALPNQATKVLLAIKSIKPNEAYAPSFKNGTRLALVRHPHAGTFEIPEVVVNNRNPEARKIVGTHAVDAIGIHHTVAQRLSGADFDGDHVIAIPNNRGVVTRTKALEGLKGFDPRASHPPYDGMQTIDGGTYNAKTKSVDYHGKSPKGSTMQNEMGRISNLITDMTIQGANTDELARAVRHSMVVIDSEKHMLDYKGSALANDIPGLKIKYQGAARGGARTLISRARAEVRVPNRKPRPASQGGPIDRKTGKKVFVPTNESFVNKKGQTIVKKFVSKQLAETDDAHTLSSGTHIERLYADHSNKLKSLANEARKTMINTKSIPYSPSAKRVYAKEVASLDAKLNIAEKNAPLERHAQVIAGAVVSQKRQANPNMLPEDVKKIRQQALAAARARTGAGKDRIRPTQEEWNAIQAGAISNHKLERILNNGDLETIKKLATPKKDLLMTSTKKARAEAMFELGYTQAEVAAQLGVSLSTLKASISE